MTSTMAIDQAQRRVNDFQQRCGEYGEAALHLAYHAALPVALNAELLHLLRINFFLDPPEVLPYTVEFEFLLSPLCREIDEGLYEIEPEIRDTLLAGLTRQYDTQRVQDIATLLWQYTEHHSSWANRVELECAQQLTALNFLNPKKAQQWLETVETEVSQGQVAAREWFVAMQQEIENQVQVNQVFHVDDRLIQETDLNALLQRFESNQATEADRQLLGQLLLANGQINDEQLILQLGRYRVNVGEGQDIHIGDRIGEESSPELLREIFQELLTLQKELSARGYDLNIPQTDLDALLERLESGQATEVDQQLLRQLFLLSGYTADEQVVLQLGKYTVNIGDGKDIHVGDRYGLSREELRRIIQELRSLQAKQEVFTASLRSLSNSQEWAIRDLIRVGRSSDNDLILPEDEPGVSREHAQISRRAPTDDDSQPTYFLQDYSRFGTWVLIPETEEWQKIHQQEVFLASGTQLKFGSSKNPALEFSIDCLDQQLEIVQRFRNDLEKGKKVAKWLDGHLEK